MARQELTLGRAGWRSAVCTLSEAGNLKTTVLGRFDPETNTWSDVPSLKMAVTSPAEVAHDGALYVMDGDQGQGDGEV